MPHIRVSPICKARSETVGPWCFVRADFVGAARKVVTPLRKRGVPIEHTCSTSPLNASIMRTSCRDRSAAHSENWIVPETLRATSSSLPLRDYKTLEDALAYVQAAPDATITMDSPCSAFQEYPDRRDFSAALALYRFRDPVPFRIGVPQDLSDRVNEFPELANQQTEPRWKGTVTELLWLHGKCVPPEHEFCGSPLHEVLKSVWPTLKLFADEFL